MFSKRTYLFILAISLLSIVWLILNSQKSIENKPEVIKIALREIGHNLLLINNDSTSLVLPVTQLSDSKYQQSFENEISIQPDTLVALFKKSFNKSNLPGQYMVEVMHCTGQEVAYSYKIENESGKDIIPCASRTLPTGCYEIKTHFLNKQEGAFYRLILLLIISLFIISVLWDILKSEKRQTSIPPENEDLGISLGEFMFYPDQSKLVCQGEEIQLSKKEGEVLSILASNLNQVIKREELAKRVWEDNGVIVGRSLDTYISKLRKRLREDSSVKLTNIHGVGYKLQVIV